MTKDFRHIGRTSADSMPPQAGTLPPVPEASQRLILGAIRTSAFAFLAAGVWLLGGGRSPLPADTSTYLGIALVVTAIADFGIIVFLKRAWSKQR